MLKQLCLSLAIALSVAPYAVATEYSDDKQVIDMDVTPDMACENDSVACRAVFRYTIFSLVDDLVVNKVIVNKDKCQADVKRFNIALKAGDYAEFTVDSDEGFQLCRPEVVEVRTSKGQNVFGYE